MLIPKDISQPLNKIKSPEGRVLISSLIMALMFVFWLWYNQIQSNDKNCEKEIQRLQRLVDTKLSIIERKDLKIDSMRLDAYIKSEAYLDSLAAINKYINDKLKK